MFFEWGYTPDAPEQLRVEQAEAGEKMWWLLVLLFLLLVGEH